MLRTYVYIPKELDEKVKKTALVKKISKAEVMRRAIERGLEEDQESRRKVSWDVAYKLAEIGKKHKVRGPRDLSKNLDKYLWGSYDL